MHFMGEREVLQRSQQPKAGRARDGIWVWLVLAVILIFFAAIRIRFLSIPLERDEGEYAYAGQLILQGIPPYRLAYNMKMPGVYYAYALVMAIFGQSVVGIHLGLLVVNLGAVALVFFVGRRLFDSTVGFVAAAAYGFLTINQWIYGPQAHATHFVVLAALGGILVLLVALKSQRLSHIFWSGLLLGIGFTMKQPGVFFVAFAVLYLAWTYLRERPIRPAALLGRASLLVGTAAAPLVLICSILYASGVFSRFWFWAVRYAGQYASEVSLGEGGATFLDHTKMMLIPSYLLWLLAGLGLILLWVDAKSRSRGIFVTSFFLFGFLSICPGFFFRPHYYVTWMPALALLIGVAVGAGRNLLRLAPALRSLSFLPGVAFVIAMFVTIHSQAYFLFSVPVDWASHMMYGNTPWVETNEIAQYIKQRTTPADTIAVLGSEPQIYFYAERKSATGYIYTYGLTEPQPFAHQMQMEMIGEIEKARPKYLVFADTETSWLRGSRADRTIFQWQARYCASNYNLAGFVQSYITGRSLSDYHTDYVWGDGLRTHKPNPQVGCIYIFERK
jgi:4-amino-4-deoxy-L-arabinose transferase-like glycosyltransferase